MSETTTMPKRTPWRAIHEGRDLPTLARRRFRQELFLNCRLAGLRDTVLERCALQSCRLEPARPADVLGLTLTLDCFVFDGLRANAVFFDTMLGLIARTQGNPEKTAILSTLVPAEVRAQLAPRPRTFEHLYRDQSLPALRAAVYRHARFLDCDFRTLSNAVFDHCRFDGCRFSPATMADVLGLTLTLDGHCFDGMILNELFLDGLLSLLARVAGQEERRAQLRALIHPRHMAQLERLEAMAQRFGWSAPDVAQLPTPLLQGLMVEDGE